jgi:uncharacterized protein (TIGR03437 family)
MPIMLRLLLGITCCLAAYAQPYIAYRGIYNVASFMAPGLPAGAIARGSTFSVFGRNLGPASTPTLSFPLETTLAGVSITVTQGATTVNAIPVGLATGQINAIMPSNAPLGMASVRVTYNSARSNPMPVRIVNSAFGIFTANSAGDGPGILQNAVDSAVPINSLQTPAKPGGVEILWGTGLGPATFPDNVAPKPVNLPVETEVFVGGIKAAVQYNGRSPCCSGIDQVVFTVPENAPRGCWVPVYVRTGGTAVSNFVTMAISDDGAPCQEPGNALASALIKGGTTGIYSPARIAVRQDVNVETTHDTSVDELGAYQARERAGPFNFNPMFSLPPIGTCTTYSVIGDLATNQNAIIPGMTPPTVGGIDAGSLSISGSKGTKTAQASSSYPGISGTVLASSLTPGAGQTNTTFLDPGAFMLALGGGADAGKTSQTLTVPSPLSWTNRDQLASVTRANGLTVNWSGGDPNAAVLIAGGGADLPSNSSSVFVCMAPNAPGSFTVPADILSNIPATQARVTRSTGAIYVGQWNIESPLKLTAAGLDFSSIVPVFASGRTVAFR